MITRREAIALTTVGVQMVGAGQALAQAAATPDIASLPRRKVELVPPPFAHPHDQVARGGPELVEFTMTIQEKPMVIDAAGTTLHAMTYDGSVPGPLMVVHQDDHVQLTLINPETNSLAHNIDFHAATGAMGGGELTMVNPGEQAVLRFKATRPGTFVYHCAPGGPMIPWHVVSGMSGAIMILPRGGLVNERNEPLRYDRLFYIGENDFYIPRGADGKFMAHGSAGEAYDDMVKVMRGLVPTHVVFNGGVGSLTGDKALKAKVGETVLFVHGQANRDTRPHLIGGHADFVWEHGKFNNPPDRDYETWFIRGGSAGAALYTFRQPGLYAYVNHNLIEAVELGAVAHVQVEGRWDDELMKQVAAPGPITM